MRIFYAAQSTTNEIDLPDSRLWYVNLFMPLRDLGHELVEFNHSWLPRGYAVDLKNPVDAADIAEHRPRFSEALLAKITQVHRENPLDLLFTYFTAAHVEPETIQRVRAMGILTMNWYCNASYQFHNVAPIAPAFDFCLVPERYRMKDYRAVGANPVFCQEAANPNIYKPCSVPCDYDVTFVGQRYGNRPHYVAELIRQGLDVRVWGPGWKGDSRSMIRRWAAALMGKPIIPTNRCGGILSDQELIEMYSRSRASLGFTTVAGPTSDEGPLKQVRLRDFEATMSGAFYVVEYFDELAECFEEDKEVIFFREPNELVDKLRFYLSHPSVRERIRAAGMNRARAEHTWHQRFEKLFRDLGLG